MEKSSEFSFEPVTQSQYGSHHEVTYWPTKEITPDTFKRIVQLDIVDPYHFVFEMLPESLSVLIARSLLSREHVLTFPPTLPEALKRISFDNINRSRNV